MSEDLLYHDPALADFYDLENGWGTDLEFCTKIARTARSVLDLGCGTGELAVALAPGRSVVAVDPARAMLEIGRAKSGGSAVEWIEGDARSLSLDRRFDLVLLTGHAFQVFLTDEDQRAVFTTIARHLGPGGRFIFDTRNPSAEEWLEWVPHLSRRELDHPRHGKVAAWNDMSHDAAAGVVTYETHYEVKASGKRLSATSQIRFTPRERLEPMLADAGLGDAQWYGDWRGSPWAPSSPEIIPLGRALKGGG
ncbi:class I SAM-dependent methyltransferase [Sinorhizobium sp. BG8]|uniref:class I SAM-dependent methyltransferase n=1 Tax=Sinorhizobium sp. BG8 TaxID=2613773 RepID=UPI00193D3AAF|nr:class I SAM-dependent methyltransferase [Sinorhizobium sp. BG8]QRM54603.1 methyltransferase domain-containing protein [Sinorhizobium sp. BG8]